MLWGALAVAAVFSWQTATVHSNYGGNWTALFCTGDYFKIPPRFVEGTYVFPKSHGFDGQWYRYIAHDPLLKTDLVQYINFAPMRYRRILVPGLASLLAFGHSRFVEAAYVAVILGFIFAGVYWSSRWAVLNGRDPCWGLAFLGVPATLISIDRLTVDVALAALTAGAAYYWQTNSLGKLYAVLAAACLARETGLLLLAAWGIVLLYRRAWRTACLFATAVLPAVAWAVYVQQAVKDVPRVRHIPRYFFILDYGLLGRMFDPLSYPLSPALEMAARLADFLALAGMLATLVIAFRSGYRAVRTRNADPAVLGAFPHLGILAIVWGKQFWEDIYGYPRPFSPMFVLLAMQRESVPKSRTWLFASVALIDLRILMHFGKQALGILQGLTLG